MRIALALAVALAACEGGLPASSAEPADASGAAKPAKPAPTRTLREVGRWQGIATPVAFAHDGRRWLAAIDRGLVMVDGGEEVSRWPVMVSGTGARLEPLANGGWFVEHAILDRDGAVTFAGYSGAHRYGRFGSPKAMAVSRDGRVAIVDGADSPSACLCDRERGTGGSRAGALVRLTFGEGQVSERVLVEHGGRECHVAASSIAVAAAEGRTVTVWPAAGDGAPASVELAGPGLKSLAWAGDRYLVGTRHVDLDRTDVVVLDRDAGWRPAWTFPVAGNLRDLAVRPDGAEVAVAFDRYRATDVVHVDERRVAVFALDGTRRAQVDTEGHPSSVAWSPRGDALLVSAIGRGEGAVIRYRTR
jgi:hypothetical protein